MIKALVLSGGAAKGAYQVGALKKWIVDDEEDYEIFCGTSVGSINGASLAQAAPGELKQRYSTLRGVWDTIGNDKIYKDWCLGKISALWKQSVLCTKPLREHLIPDNMDVDALLASGRKFRSVSVNWRTGQLKVATEADSDICGWIYASASLPMFFEPALVDGELYTDGGLREAAPLSAAIDLGATDIDVIITSNPDIPDNWDTSGEKTLGFALRAVDIMSTEILLNDIRVCMEKNKTAALVKFIQESGLELPPDLAEYSSLRHVNIRLLKPSGVVTHDSLDFEQENVQAMMELGYADACNL